jgi:ATP-dependent Clp protease ATP-binding subunit ClpX
MFILRKKKSEVEILISGKDGYICENCVEQAHSIVKESVG